jgi:hypothetical protein
VVQTLTVISSFEESFGTAKTVVELVGRELERTAGSIRAHDGNVINEQTNGLYGVKETMANGSTKELATGYTALQAACMLKIS